MKPMKHGAHKAEQEPKLVKEEELYQRLSAIEQKLLEAKKKRKKQMRNTAKKRKNTKPPRNSWPE